MGPVPPIFFHPYRANAGQGFVFFVPVRRGQVMAGRNKKSAKAAFQAYNVVYEDDSLSSNRRVSAELLENLYGEDPLDLARLAIEKQDDEIAQRSGFRKPKIKTIVRA